MLILGDVFLFHEKAEEGKAAVETPSEEEGYAYLKRERAAKELLLAHGMQAQSADGRVPRGTWAELKLLCPEFYGGLSSHDISGKFNYLKKLKAEKPPPK